MAAPAAGAPADAIGGLVLPPLATAAQVQAIVNALPATVQAAVQASVPAAVQASVQAAIAPLLAQMAALAPATMASTAMRIADARRFNCGRRLPFRIVPRDGGADPVHWLPGLSYALVQGMAHAQLNNLLGEYGLPLAGVLAVKRERLLEHIGYYSVERARTT
jgi:hypothetical protein